MNFHFHGIYTLKTKKMMGLFFVVIIVSITNRKRKMLEININARFAPGELMEELEEILDSFPSKLFHPKWYVKTWHLIFIFTWNIIYFHLSGSCTGPSPWTWSSLAWMFCYRKTSTKCHLVQRWTTSRWGSKQINMKPETEQTQ